MTDRPYKPGPSSIHGLGVIATRLIHAGERVHCDLGPEYNGFNHSCSPNLGLVYPRRDKRRLYAPYRFALRDIAPQEELTVDYRVWGTHLEFICRCPKCRKEIA